MEQLRDLLVALGAVALLLVLLGVPVLGLFLFLRLRELTALRQRIAKLEQRVARGEQERGAAGPMPVREPEPPSTPAAPRAPSAATGLSPDKPLPQFLARSASGAAAAAPEPPAQAGPVTGSLAPVFRSAPEPALAPKPAARINWEHWLGVKGAALLGAAILAFAGLLFVQYSIQRGWIGPELRCLLAAGVGLGCIAGSGLLLRRGYRATSDGITGAGTTLILGAVWAARVQYELLPFWLALLLLCGAVLVCGWLAVRRDSRTIALFGLLGGFATPLLLSMGSSNAVGLFAYLLLLNIAVLTLARQRTWPLLSTLAAIATPLLFGLWIAWHFDGTQLLAALVFLGLLSMVFAFTGGTGRSRSASIAGSIAPFVFAVYFAGSAQVSTHIAPIGCLFAVLSIAAVWSARRLELPALSLAAGIGSAAGLAIWISGSQLHAALVWECAVVGSALVAILHLGSEWAARLRADSATAFAQQTAGGIFAIGLAGLLGACRASDAPLWPWLLLALCVAAALVRAVAMGGRASLLLTGLGLIAANFIGWRDLGRPADPVLLPGWLEALLVCALPLSAVLARRVSAREPLQRWWAISACALCGLLLVERAGLAGDARCEVLPLLLTLAVLHLVGLYAARQVAPVLAFGLLGLLSAYAQLRWAEQPGRVWDEQLGLLPAPYPALQLGLMLLLGSSGGLTLLFDRQRLAAHRGAWRVTVLLIAAWSLPVGVALGSWSEHFKDWMPFGWPALLGFGLALATWEQRLACDAQARRAAGAVGFAWSAGLASLAASFALAFFANHAEGPVALSLAALGWCWAARMARHPGLRTGAVLLCVAATLALGLLALSALDNGPSFERSGFPIVHWLSYGVGLPALALLACTWLLRPLPEASTAPHKERLHQIPHSMALVGLCTVLALFTWLNFEIVNLCSSGERYELGFARLPLRDVSLSIAWTGFSLALLLLGLRLDRSSLRWTSLAFFLATIGKVFLYDLGELNGLSRVGSLIGLAVALLSVSVLYQRVVFRRKPASPAV